MKNSLQFGVALLIAVMVSLLTFVAMYLVYLLHWVQIDSLTLAAVPVVVLLSTMLMVYFTINVFVFRKLETIYEIME